MYQQNKYRQKLTKSKAEIFENKKKLSAVQKNFYKVFDMLKDSQKIVLINADDCAEAINERVFEAVRPLFE